MLAHLLRTDLIPEICKQSPRNQAYQRVLRQRAFYIGGTTRTKNKIRAILAQQGEMQKYQEKREKERNRYCVTFSFII